MARKRPYLPFFRIAFGALMLGAFLSSAATPARATPLEYDYRYEQNLLELSEVLGTLHYLDRLCVAYDDRLWRERMIELLQAEDAVGERRAALVYRFNQGFRGMRVWHNHCSEPTRFKIAHLQARGELLMRWFAGRWRVN